MTFNELVKKISPTLKRITYKLNRRFMFFNEEDLFQEALIFLWQEFKERKLEDKTTSYILQGCYFHLKNYLRKTLDKKKLVSFNILVNNEGNRNLEEILLLDNRPLEEGLNAKLLFEAMRDNGLTSKEKNVLLLFLEGLTVREIAKKVGVSHVRIVKMKANIRRKSEYLLDR